MTVAVQDDQREQILAEIENFTGKANIQESTQTDHVAPTEARKRDLCDHLIYFTGIGSVQAKDVLDAFKKGEVGHLINLFT